MSRPASRWLALPFLLGLYLTAHGYHSRDGDQAYRLPLLHHLQDASLFADDPFVRALDAFNPHAGYLALLDVMSRPLGLSAALFGLFVVSFTFSVMGIDRIARSVWPVAGKRVGIVAIVLFLLAQAGNIGTNHLFEATLLDRLLALSIGWLALAAWVDNPAKGRWISPPILGISAWIHPSMGLQLAMLLGGTWVLEWLITIARSHVPGGNSFLDTPRPPVSRGAWERARSLAGQNSGNLVSLLWLAACLLPTVRGMGSQGDRLFQGLSSDEFRLLSAYVQSPQHMVPHLWRMPQWLAWACYPLLAILAMAEKGRARGITSKNDDAILLDQRPWPRARVRLALLLAVNLFGLAVALVGIEGFQDLRVTLFQPFRMATVFRGLCLVFIAGRVTTLWSQGDLLMKFRAVLIAAGLIGDWTMVVATLVELSATIAPRIAPLVFIAGMAYLSGHDTESGQIRLSLALVGLAGYLLIQRVRPLAWDRRRASIALVAAWAVPSASAWVAMTSMEGKIADSLVSHCRFFERPVGDLERIAVWCRGNTPSSARFVGPPGPKGFRLWSRRSLVFNRAGSPYHAAGLLDWATRFQDHVGHHGSKASFVAAYLADRHRLEARFDEFSDDELAALARRQGADHVLKGRPAAFLESSPLELLHVEGKYAVYRVRAVAETSYPSATFANASH